MVRAVYTELQRAAVRPRRLRWVLWKLRRWAIVQRERTLRVGRERPLRGGGDLRDLYADERLRLVRSPGALPSRHRVGTRGDELPERMGLAPDGVRRRDDVFVCGARVRPEQLRDGLVWELCVGASMLQWTMRDGRHDLHVRGPGVRSQQLRDGFVWELCVGAGVLQWTMRDSHVELHESHELCFG